MMTPMQRRLALKAARERGNMPQETLFDFLFSIGEDLDETERQIDAMKDRIKELENRHGNQ